MHLSGNNSNTQHHFKTISFGKLFLLFIPLVVPLQHFFFEDSATFKLQDRKFTFSSLEETQQKIPDGKRWKGRNDIQAFHSTKKHIRLEWRWERGKKLGIVPGNLSQLIAFFFRGKGFFLWEGCTICCGENWHRVLIDEQLLKSLCSFFVLFCPSAKRQHWEKFMTFQNAVCVGRRRRSRVLIFSEWMQLQQKSRWKIWSCSLKTNFFFIIYKCIHSGSYKITYTFVLQVIHYFWTI